MPLRHKGFRLLVAGQLASTLGDACYAVALPWYVLANHGGALLLATVLAAYGIPRTALIAVGGPASDKWRPWTVMLAADTVRAVAVGVFAVAVLLGPARAAVLVPIAAIIGAGEGLFMPASFSIVPTLVPDDDLQAGNAVASSAMQLASLLGPALGGVIVAVVGPTAALFVDAASFVVSAVTLVAVGTTQRATQAVLRDRESTPARLGPIVRSARVLRLILLVTLVGNLSSGGLSEVALPALAHGPLHSGATGYGLLIAAFGLGALAGTIVAGQLSTLAKPCLIGSWAFLAEAFFVALIPYLGGTFAAGVALALFGLCNGFANVLTITAFQRWAPPNLLGRLMGLLLLASMGIFPVSVALAGVVVHNFGPAVFFAGAGVSLAITILLSLTQRSWREFGAPVRTAHDAPQALAGEPFEQFGQRGAVDDVEFATAAAHRRDDERHWQA